MKVLLLVSLLCAVTIDDADFVSSDGNQMLSLRPTASDNVGTAWYFRWEGNDKLLAFTGPYELDNSGPVPGVRLGLSHLWYREADEHGGLSWNFDYDYLNRGDRRYGVLAEYESSTSGVDLSVIRCMEIDQQGNPSGRLVEPTEIEHLGMGEIVRLEEGSMSIIAGNPPPGFMNRSKWTNRIREKPNTIYRTDLLEKDWYGWQVDDRTYIVLSLHAGDAWDAGNARLFAYSFKDIDNRHYLYARGTYSIDLANEIDALLIDLRMTRYYRAPDSRGALEWEANDTSRDATGLTLCVPLDDRSLRDETQSFFVASTYFVDEQGNAQSRRNNDAGFLRPATVKNATSALSLSLGTAYEVYPGDLFSSGENEKETIARITDNPPPGFQLRPRIEPHVVAKAIVENGGQVTEDNLGALFEYASHSYKEGHYTEAVKAYTKLLEVDPNNDVALRMRGHCYYDIKHYMAASADFTASLDIKPTANAYYWRGQVCLKLREYRPALEDFKRANRLDPKDPLILNTAGWLWATCPEESIRDGRRAILAAKKACELTSWQESYCVDTLAAAYAEAGDFGNAIHFQELAQRELVGEVWESGNRRLEAYRRGEPYRQP